MNTPEPIAQNKAFRPKTKQSCTKPIHDDIILGQALIPFTPSMPKGPMHYNDSFVPSAINPSAVNMCRPYNETHHFTMHYSDLVIDAISETIDSSTNTIQAPETSIMTEKETQIGHY